MTRRIGPIALLALCVSLVSTPHAPAEDRTESETPPGLDEPGHSEQPDDPPVRVPRETLQTSPAMTVVRGNHVSIQVNVDGLGNNIVGDAANEPSLAIDPTDANVIVIGWRQFDTIASNFRQAGYGYSHDAGMTWTFPGVLDPGQFRSDPVLAADSDGTIFYYSLSSVTSAEMFTSDDGGVTWAGPTPAFGGDKTWIAIDTTAGIGNDHVYAIWNSQFTCCEPGTDFTRTTDGGLSYDGPFSMPSKAKWGTLDVGPGGEVYVVGTRTTPLAFPQPHMLMRSATAQDAARTPSFDPAVGFDLGGSTLTGQTPNPGGLMGQVWVAVDRSGGITDGNIYVLGSVDPPDADPLDVMFVKSTDGGQTFGSPVRLHETRDGYQWFGTMSVAPDGRIDAVWNDTRDDPSGQTSEVLYAYSTNAGSSWSAGLPVTPAWNSLVGHPNQNKIGDYYHMISDADGAALAYSATFNGEQDIWFLRVGDCNDNGAHDSADITTGASIDCNLNGQPDECEEGTVICIDCDDDGTCELGEDCLSCPGDCLEGPAGCGNGVCEPGLGEDCTTCAEDCNGKLKGNPKNQFCCGADGTCNESGCSTDGFSCSPSTVSPTCCGDLVCEGTENSVICAVDCPPGTGFCGDGVCQPGEDCESCSADCEGVSKGNPRNRFCCGNGTLEPAEGAGAICDGNP